MLKNKGKDWLKYAHISLWPFAFSNLLQRARVPQKCQLSAGVDPIGMGWREEELLEFDVDDVLHLRFVVLHFAVHDARVLAIPVDVVHLGGELTRLKTDRFKNVHNLSSQHKFLTFF